MSLPRYKEYKDSGVSWLGAMPAHWSVRRYKQVFVEREERSENGQETLLSVSAYTGVSPRSEIVDDGDHLSRAESLEGYKVCYPDDLVMNIMLAWNRGLGFSSFHGIVSPAYSVFKPLPGTCPRFLDYMVRSDQVTLYYKAFSSGVIDSRLRLYPDTFGSLYCVLPPRDEQTAIAVFLDRETAKIDALIAEQEKLITLLAEKRQTSISHAVTKGLNPDAPVKDSGVAWLGKVPSHWDVRKIRRIASTVQTGGTPTTESPQTDLDGGVDWYTPGDFNSRLILGRASKRVSKRIVMSGEAKFFPADSILIVSIGATLGKVGFIDRAASANQQINALTLPKTSNSRFFTYSLSVKVDAMKFLSNASTIGIMNQEKTKEIVVAVPPVGEQEEIVAFLDTETNKIDALEAEALKVIVLLKERRTALISGAVTGQIDVRGTMPQAVAEDTEVLAA